MRTYVAGADIAQLEASADKCRARSNEIRKFALTVVSNNMRDDFLQMSREWEALAEQADGEKAGLPLL